MLNVLSERKMNILLYLKKINFFLHILSMSMLNKMKILEKNYLSLDHNSGGRGLIISKKTVERYIYYQKKAKLTKVDDLLELKLIH